MPTTRTLCSSRPGRAGELSAAPPAAARATGHIAANSVPWRSLPVGSRRLPLLSVPGAQHLHFPTLSLPGGASHFPAAPPRCPATPPLEKGPQRPSSYPPCMPRCISPLCTLHNPRDTCAYQRHHAYCARGHPFGPCAQDKALAVLPGGKAPGLGGVRIEAAGAGGSSSSRGPRTESGGAAFLYVTRSVALLSHVHGGSGNAEHRRR